MAKHVFISYSHDSGAHVDRVLALADRLRGDGIDAQIDQYVGNPPEGWPRWMHRQLLEADAVLLVCTTIYRRRFEGAEQPGVGQGGSWEGLIAQQLLYDAGSRNHKLIPVYFEGGSADDIPLILRGATHHRLAGEDRDDDPEYENLISQLVDRPRVPPIGQARPTRRGPGRQSARPSTRLGSQFHVDNGDATIGTQINADVVNLGSLTVTMPSPIYTPARAPERAVEVPTTIALFSANATLSGHHLQLEEEMAAIGDALRSTRFRDRYVLRLCPAATLDTLIRELDEIQPQVVHICGHADREGRITLKRGGSEHCIVPAQLAALFAALEEPPRLVVFASCHSLASAKAVVGTVAYAIGFEAEIYDETASVFSRSFYERLGSRAELEVPRAFRLAKLATIAGGYSDAQRARLLPDDAQQAKEYTR